MRSFMIIRSLRNGEIALSFTDIGKLCLRRELLTSQKCLLMLLAKIKLLRKFPNLQYLNLRHANFNTLSRTKYKRTGYLRKYIVMLSRHYLALFQSTSANKMDSEHTRDYKRLLPVCEAEILRVTVKRIEVFSYFLLISDDFRLKVPNLA